MQFSRFETMTLRLQAPTPDTCTVEVSSSPAGETAPISVPLTSTLRDLSAGSVGPIQERDALLELGQALAAFLMPPAVIAVYRAALSRLPSDCGLRLRLQIDSPALAAIPWEYLYDSDTGAWPALDPRTPMVRYYALPFRPGDLSQPATLRILGVIAAPSDVDATVDAAAEKHNLLTALDGLIQDGSVHVEFLPRPATMERLQVHMRQDFHVIHYIGHGAQDVRHSVLLFEREDGRTHLVPADDIAMLFRNTGIRLVCLNACTTATHAAGTFGGIAPALVRAAVPAVVAMQYAISDQGALTFSRAFYAAVADRWPIDLATTEARKALKASSTVSSAEWGFPILFMRAPDGHLWQKPQAEEAVPSAPYRCPHCGGSVRAQSRFCPHCGQSLTQGGVTIGHGSQIVGPVAGGDITFSGDIIVDPSRKHSEREQRDEKSDK